MSADGRFNSDASAINFEAKLAIPNLEFGLEASGEHDLAQSSGQAEIYLQPIEFGLGSLQPVDLAPSLADALSDVSGTVWGNATTEWGSGQIHSRFEFFASDLNAASDLASIERLNAAITFREGGTPEGQLISMARINFGLELTDGLIQYQIHPDGIIEIESASWKFAGGELRTMGRIDPGSSDQEISLQVKGTEVAELIGLIDLKGLSGSGTLDGELPLFLSGGDVEIRNAVLRSRDGGIIRYQPDGAVTNLGAVNQQFSQTLKILENLHYDELEFKINGIASGAVLIEVHLKGVNPDYMDGQAVVFNLSLDEQQLPALLQASRFSYRVPNTIQEKFDASNDSRRE
jgi:hypothetical protein